MQGSAGVVAGRRHRVAAGAILAAALALAAPAAAGAIAGSDGKPDRARSSGKRIDVVLGLDRQRTGLQQLARKVSDPGSPRYGHYVRPERIARRFGASMATRNEVRGFLRRRGIRSRVDVTGSFAEALVPAAKARRLFGKVDGSTGRVRRGLRGHVRTVLQLEAAPGQGLGRRGHRPLDGRRGSATPAEGPAPGLAPPYVRTGTPDGCEQGLDATFQPENAPLAGPAFTPNQIQTAYRASQLHARGVTGTGVRAAVLIEGWARSELRAFTECFGLQMPPTRLVTVGRKRATPADGESALDLQMLTMMAPGLESLTVYSVGSPFWPAQFSAMLDRENAPGGRLPHVISVSQGDCESDDGRAQVRLSEKVLAAAAASGVTVAAGSGDAGSFCTSGRVGFYPSSSRWVTSVGGTSLVLEDSNAIAREAVWNDEPLGLTGAGGGGFSKYLRAPFYQRSLNGWGDRRGYPDAASMADGYPSIVLYCGSNGQGECEPDKAANPFEAGSNGTSAATPIFIGAVALANQVRREAGRPPLGFVNPLLYELGARGGGGALRDVVEGSNALEFHCCEAAPGYDLASGWGSVDAAGLAAVVRAPGA